MVKKKEFKVITYGVHVTKKFKGKREDRRN